MNNCFERFHFLKYFWNDFLTFDFVIAICQCTALCTVRPSIHYANRYTHQKWCKFCKNSEMVLFIELIKRKKNIKNPTKIWDLNFSVCECRWNLNRKVKNHKYCYNFKIFRFAKLGEKLLCNRKVGPQIQRAKDHPLVTLCTHTKSHYNWSTLTGRSVDQAKRFWLLSA